MSRIGQRDPVLDAQARVFVFFGTREDRDRVLRKDGSFHRHTSRSDTHDGFFLCSLMRCIPVDRQCLAVQVHRTSHVEVVHEVLQLRAEEFLELGAHRRQTQKRFGVVIAGPFNDHGAGSGFVTPRSRGAHEHRDEANDDNPTMTSETCPHVEVMPVLDYSVLVTRISWFKDLAEAHAGDTHTEVGNNIYIRRVHVASCYFPLHLASVQAYS